MLRLVLAVLSLAALVLAHPPFTFTIGNAVASQDFHSKNAALALRTEGCADPAKSQITATAEGLVNGSRQSLVLQVMPASKPGVYAVAQNWPPGGAWVVSLRGTCAGESAGAIVPFGPKGMIRESTNFFSRPATEGEIAASLKALSQEGNNK
jgi:hypothetical protein